MWHFQMCVVSNFFAVHQHNYCTLKTKINWCFMIKVALNGIDIVCATQQAHKSIKHSESDSMLLNQLQNPLCRIILYLIWFFYFRFHIRDTIILSSSSQFALLTLTIKGLCWLALDVISGEHTNASEKPYLEMTQHLVCLQPI